MKAFRALRTSRAHLSAAGVSILDQAALSATNFGLALLYARWLSREAYGAFAVLFAIFLFLSGFQNALVLEPMSVLGARRTTNELGGYLRSVVRLNLCLTFGIALITVAIGRAVFGRESSVLQASGGLAVALPLVLLHWLLRRISYLVSRPNLALAGSMVYALAACAATILLAGWKSAASPFVVMAAAALAASIVLYAVRVIPKGDCHTGGVLHSAMDVLREHWSYGRWVFGLVFLSWTGGPMFTLMLGWLYGTSTAAGLRAAENFAVPLTQVFTALGLLLLPIFARRYVAMAAAQFSGLAAKLALGAVILGIAYFGFISLFGHLAFEVVYKGRYVTSEVILPLVCLSVATRGVSDMSLGLLLKAAAWPQAQFWAGLVSAAVALSGGAWLVTQFGLLGAALGEVSYSVVQISLMCALFARFKRAIRPREEPLSPSFGHLVLSGSDTRAAEDVS